MQIAFYNKNVKYSIYLWLLFFPPYLKWTFVSTFVNGGTIFGYS